MVFIIDHVEQLALVVDGQIGGVGPFLLLALGKFDLVEMFAIWAVDLDTGIAGVGDINMIPGIEGHPQRAAELRFCAATFAKAALEFSFVVVDDNPV